MMQRVPVWTMLLPLMLLAACQSTGQSGGGSSTPQAYRNCPPRLQDAGQCGTSSIYVFPELTSVR